VFGDVNSTLACAVAASKLMIPIVHVEAGLRSFDRSMPEEINRIVTDVLSDLLLVSEPYGLKNLRDEGIPAEKVHFTGNIMIDSLERMLPEAEKRRTYDRFGLHPGEYAYLTLHRPSNVDQPQNLSRLVALFAKIAQDLPIIFPVHPRTKDKMTAMGLQATMQQAGMHLCNPVDYLDSLCLQRHAKVVLTDSGGIQEETSHLRVPCLTLRDNTERPITVERGTATLVGNDPQRIRLALQTVLDGRYKQGEPIPLWDGHTAERIVAVLAKRYPHG
jgi:UDP-N-acetylglucosamine 2-epimerase (non-hydrolysing)